jgi:ribosomal subunit interface protein
MRIDVRSTRFGLTDAIREHAERRTAAALEKARLSNVYVMVRLSDINGVRGGVDKSCRISVRLPRLGWVIAHAVDRDLYGAIDRAAIRLGRLLRRRLSRRRTMGRQGPRFAPGSVALAGLA